MFLNLEMMGISTPPPQGILDKRPCWFLLMVLLGATMILRMVSLDMLGGLLCALMICLCFVILRDGMRELPKFGLMFGLLCGVNFVFYAMPVLGAIVAGKTEQHVEPMKASDLSRYNQIHRLTYTLTVRTSSFFDFSRGWIYNAQSAGEVLMPIAMLLGTYLGISAHYEYQSHVADFLIGSDEDDEIGGAREDLFGVAGDAGDAADGFAANARAGTYGAIFGAATGGVAPPRPAPPKLAHKAFQGASHKLSP